MKHRTLLIAILAGLITPSLAPVSAAPANAPTTAQAAFLYGYMPKPGQRGQFIEGYRRHLQWHRRHHDSLAWHGWFVVSGKRLGMFIDGSFGAPFSAFDKRVDPKGDRADAIRNFTGFVTPVFRSAYVLRPDLSTGEPLEKRQPPRTIQVVHYTLRPGTAEQFESAVRSAKEHLQDVQEAPVHTWYRRVEGGEHPAYMLMVARENWASYGRSRKTLAQWAGADEAAHLEASVKRIYSEIWRYRPDLSLLPDDGGH